MATTTDVTAGVPMIALQDPHRPKRPMVSEAVAEPTDEFMTVAEVAAILKLNQQTVRNWIDQGKLPALHIGRRVRVRRADFDALLDASASGDPKPAPPTIWDGEIPQPQAPSEV